MNGAKAEVCANTRTKPRAIKTMTIGSSHHFFCVLINSQNSTRIDSLDIVVLSVADAILSGKPGRPVLK